MPRHPGDPRSNVLGEQEYDEHEYPNVHYTPPAAPPVTGNVDNYTQFRGHEQHGVAFTRNPQEDSTTLPYAEEQRAQDKYNDPTITPRDLTQVPPIRVQVSDAPDLLFRRLARATSYTLTPDMVGTWIQIAQPNNMRKRLQVTSQILATGSVIVVQLCPSDQTPSDLESLTARGGSNTQTIFDSAYTGGLWLKLVNVTAASVNSVSVLQEYTQTDGEALMR